MDEVLYRLMAQRYAQVNFQLINSVTFVLGAAKRHGEGTEQLWSFMKQMFRSTKFTVSRKQQVLTRERHCQLEQTKAGRHELHVRRLAERSAGEVHNSGRRDEQNEGL